jgi:hypothetical protein
VLLAAVVLGLNDHDLLSSISSTGDDGLQSLVFCAMGSDGVHFRARTTRPTLRTVALSVNNLRTICCSLLTLHLCVVNKNVRLSNSFFATLKHLQYVTVAILRVPLVGLGIWL